MTEPPGHSGHPSRGEIAFAHGVRKSLAYTIERLMVNRFNEEEALRLVADHAYLIAKRDGGNMGRHQQLEIHGQAGLWRCVWEVVVAGCDRRRLRRNQRTYGGSMNPREIVQKEKDLLAGRMARCTSCKREVPSDLSLAFFEYRGEGSRAATDTCGNCHYAKVAHEYNGKFAPPSDRLNPRLCLNFDPPQEFKPHGPWDVDLFYCGCRGWD